MKVKAIFCSFLFTLFGMTTVFANPTSEPIATDMTKQEYKAALDVLQDKVSDLRTAKKNASTKAEKQEIRAEIKGVKKEAEQLKQQAVNGGIYIGGGVLILIVLLILLL